MSTSYEKPTIDKLESGLMNKFGRAPGYNRRIRESIDGVAVDDLIEKYGSPLFVFSERTIRRLHSEMRRAYCTRYPDVTFAWSYKTNYLGAICSVMHQEGSIAEVVSQMEYDKARSLGVPGSRILFNGPYKPIPALRRAIEEGASIHIDCEDEIEDIEQVAKELGKTARVAVRLNLDAGIHPQWSRFGFNLESGQARKAIDRLLETGRLQLVGLHCHIGTYILDPDAYARQVRKMIALMKEVEQAHREVEIDYLDIGGGLPSRSRLKGTYLPADIATPSIDEYAESVCGAMLDALPVGRQPRLVLESGRALIDEAGLLLTSVVATKRLPDGTRSYVLDAGVNVLFTGFWYRFNIDLCRAVPGAPETSVLYGPLCMNIDVVDEGVALPPLPRGTPLCVGPVGAYNVTQSMQFIHYRPNVVMIMEDGTVEMIREEENLQDLTANEMLPQQLQRFDLDQ